MAGNDFFANYPNVSPASSPAVNQASPLAQVPDAWLKNYIQSQGELARARIPRERGIINLLTGRDVRAAQDAAGINAPAAYAALQQAQATGEGANLDLAQTRALIQRLGALNPTSFLPSQSAPQAQQEAGPTTQITPGSLLPQQPSGSDTSQDAIRRMLFNTATAMMGLPKFSSQGLSMLDSVIPPALRNAGVGVGSSGALVDIGNGQNIGSSISDFLATQARKQEAAKQSEIQNTNTLNNRQQYASKIGEQENQAGLQRGTNALEAGNQVGVAQSKSIFDQQQSELKDLNTQSADADKGIQIASGIFNAANGLYTGYGAQALQDLRKSVIGIGSLLGTQVPDSIVNSASSFEQLRFLGQQLVAIAGKQLSPRLAQQLYERIEQVKPGDKTSAQGLRDIITKQIMPVFLHTKGVARAVGSYYNKNPMARNSFDVQDANPLSNFGVKDVRKAQPGDYYINPNTNGLEQY